jgi:hypothetical protein
MPILQRMSDLSQLLGDLYADETPTRAPSWSSEEALDDAFSSWVPGPPDDAPSAERSIVADAWNDTVVDVPATDAAPELEPALETWLADTAPVVEPTSGQPRWSPSDDDILPSRRGRRFRLALR